MTQHQDLLTRHARLRCSQRGVSDFVVDIVDAYADIEIPAARGCRARQTSYAAIATMVADGISIENAEAAARVALIVGPEGRVVTVLKVGPADRRVRKPSRRHCRQTRAPARPSV